MAIEESRAEEILSVQDRGFALSLSEDENTPSQDVINLPEVPNGVRRMGLCPASYGSFNFQHQSSSVVAGPSAHHYAHRQGVVFEQLSQHKVECIVCRESVHPRAPCVWHAVMYIAGRASSLSSCVLPRMKASSHQNVTAIQLTSRPSKQTSQLKSWPRIEVLSLNLLARTEYIAPTLSAPSSFPCRSEHRIMLSVENVVLELACTVKH